MSRLYARVVYGVVAIVVLSVIYRTTANSHVEFSKAKAASLWSSGAYKRENATFVTLARNGDLEKLLPAVMSVEDRFNHKYNYDWVFLNEEEFTQDFIDRMSQIVSGTPKFGTIPKKFWGYPEWVDQDKAAESRKKLSDQGVIYGDNESYRHMCRFESGFFFHHELMLPYKYYWRVEPETQLLCDIEYDVFRFMREKKKKYGWTLSLTEWELTIPTLWEETLKFVDANKDTIHPKALQGFVRDAEDKNKYNLCHFWSNFEVADADFWRAEAYQKYFNYLDKTGKFFYERWGDAPVHSLAVSLFMDQDEVHFFDDIGYRHPPFQHCPADCINKKLRCNCVNSFDWHKSSCLKIFLDAKGLPLPPDYHEPTD